MPVIICPPFRHVVSGFNYFDDTYWTASPGSWTGTQWYAGYPDGGITLTELGTWNVGFRPSSVDMTVQFPSGYNGSNNIVNVYDTNNGLIGSITILIAEGTGVLVKNIPLTFTTFDISHILMTGDPYPDYYIQDIVFNP